MNQAPIHPDPGGISTPRRNLLWLIPASWIAFVGSSTLCALLLPGGNFLTAFGDITLGLTALFATFALALNVGAPPRRSRAFWALMAAGCGAWTISQGSWTYFEVYRHQPVPNPFIGDIISFLHAVPMIGALALRPHDRRGDLHMHTGYVDFSLLLVWWVYLYLFAVIPWQYIAPDVARYGTSFDYLEGIENLLLAAGLAMCVYYSKGAWRKIYRHLFLAALLFAFAAYAANVAIDKNVYYTGGLFDLPLMAALVWMGTAGILAYQHRPSSAIPQISQSEPSPWPARFAMVTAISMPFLAIWSAIADPSPLSVRQFRIVTTQVTIVLVSLLLFLRRWLVDQDRARLLLASQETLEDLKRFQSTMIQTEKLVSLGQLAAGAAHEINNPLTGIIGYSEMLAAQTELSEKQRATVEKISALAGRIKGLVTNLLSFARRVPPEKGLLDISQVIASALNLSNLEIRGKHIHVEFIDAGPLPVVRGDANQIMQVFFNLADNAVDALDEVGGGVLVIRAIREASNVVIEFSDNGAGIKSPNHVFDPFFTTKPAGKGTGLGLSICYGIVQEHDGTIECFNRPGGGATFRVTLPVAVEAVRTEENDPAHASHA
jgi:signal transduction histidine kinase